MPTVAASQVLTPDGVVGPAIVRWEGDVVSSVEPAASAPDRVLCPGFVDLQVNGIDDVDVASADGQDWARLDELLLRQGVTAWCPTLITMPLHRYDAPLSRIKAAMDRPATTRPRILGAHLEGPFLGAATGAHPQNLVAPIDLGWLGCLPAHVRLVTLGAEQPLAAPASRLLRDRGTAVSIGHTRASADEFDAVVAAGAGLVTHLFNGMSGVHHRDLGVAALALSEPAVCCSLIADGVHVHPRVLRLACAALGPDRAVLVTDAVAWRGGRVGAVALEVRDGAPRLPDGTLAGSTVTMDAAVRTCVAAGVPLEAVLRAASVNPARVAGVAGHGGIAPGSPASFVALDGALQVEQVWVDGAAAAP